MADSNSSTLLLKFHKDTKFTVSREAVKKMVEILGLNNEEEVVHYALSMLAESILTNCKSCEAT
jgi:hypothetical protein